MKFLGIQNILNKTSTTQLDILGEDTQRLALRIATRRAAPTTKMKVYNMHELPRIGYFAPHLTSSLKYIRKQLDKPVQNLLRNLLSSMPTSVPTKLHYNPKTKSGKDSIAQKTRYQQQKWP